MNEIDIILVKINKEINDIAYMESSFDRYISIRDLLKDLLTKYGRAEYKCGVIDGVSKTGEGWNGEYPPYVNVASKIYKALTKE